MKKYRFLKWFVLFVAIGSVLCFFIPFTDPLRYHNHQLPDNLYYFKNPFTPNGTPLGIEFVIGRAAISNSVLTAAIWLSRVSFAVALAAIVFAVLSLTMKDVNGLNKQGKFHKSLIISPILAFLSALINFITIQVGNTIECTMQVEKYEWTDKGYGFAGFNYYRYYAFTGNYTWIGLVIIGLLLIPVVILAISAKKEIASGEAAPQVEKSTAGEGQKKDKPKSGFFKQWKRSKGAIYGDIEGPMTKLKRGRMSIAYEDGKLIAFLLGAGEFELSEENVERLELIEENVPCENITNMYGVKKEIDRYKIVMKDGQVGTLRLDHRIADAVVGLLGGDSDETNETEETSAMDELGEETKSALTFFQKAAESPDSPIGKSLDWFQSEKGLEVYKVYTAPKNFLLQSRYVQEFKKMFADEKTNVDFDRHFLPVTYPDAKLPRTYYKALLESLGAEAVKNDVVRAFLLNTLLSISIPYTLDEDGEPVPRDTSLVPEQFVSAEKNPLLYFVKNFNVFKFEHDDLGHLAEKFIIYRAAVSCILPFVASKNKVDIQWLLDKDTYINEFGVLRKLKGFIKKCKELTDNAEYHQYLDEILKKLLAEMESDKKE